jgi:hypothetical protein
MLKITPVEYFPEHDVSAYTDDTRWWVRYLIPGHVSIRRDANGHPVFQLLEYAFSDEDRERDPDLPAGGGSMTMDVELKVDKAAEDAIRAKLQEEVDATWQRLKAAADAAGQPVQGARLNAWFRGQGPFGDQDVTFGLGTGTPESPPGDRPPQVVFAHPTWTEGTFKLSAPQSDALISHRVAEGPLSLVGNEVASASFDLTAAGATLIRKTLTNPDGTGATDLVPIQAEFQMKFLARIPPVKVMATADSSSLYTSIQSIYHDYEDNGCDEDSLVHFEHHLETAEQSGLITVKLDTGTLELTDDLAQQLRSDALKTVQDLIKDRMFEKRPAPPAPADDKTKDFVSRDSDVYYFKSSYDAASMHIGYTEELQSVKAWPVNPQGTLQAFLAGVPAAEMSQYIRRLDLSDSLFESLQLEVTVFADWADEPISFVDCQLKYSGVDENNQQVDKFETLTFTKDHTSEVWDPSLIGSKRQYSYRWRVGFTGREPGEFSDWQEETSPRLNLTVADPGKVAVKVLAGNVNFAQTTRQVQVDLEYAAPGVDPETVTLMLNSGQQEQQYQRYIYTAWNRPVRYRTRFFLQNDQTLESDWGSTTSRQLVINEPPSNRKLDVQLVPVGDWTDVAQTVVDLRYAGADGDTAEGVYVLKGTDEFRSWMVVLKDPTKRKFSYKVLTSFKDGSPPATSGWQEAESDQSLPILVKRSPHLSVNLFAELVNFDDTPIVMVKLGYHDDLGSIHKSQTFPLRRGAEPATWSFPIADDRRRSYLQQITYNTADGDVVKLAEEANDATAIAVPKLKVPEVSCLVVPRPVDFVQTPVVELTIDYSDVVNRIEASETLVFVDPTPQSFRVRVEEDSPREYQVTTTYYLADGTTVSRDPVTLDKTKIVVPKYLPAA